MAYAWAAEEAEEKPKNPLGDVVPEYPSGDVGGEALDRLIRRVGVSRPLLVSVCMEVGVLAPDLERGGRRLFIVLSASANLARRSCSTPLATLEASE